jgi:hypothetical protein
MLTITNTPEDLRLLEAAEIAESSGKYEQGSYGRCGSPACLLGGYAWRNNGSAAYAYLNTGGFWQKVLTEFGLTSLEGYDLFGTTGCDDAGTDGKKAAAYVRRFVRERAEQRIRG